MDFQFFATYGLTDGRTDRLTNLVIEAPCRSFKKEVKSKLSKKIKTLKKDINDKLKNFD